MKEFNSEEVESLRESGILHCGPPFRVSFSQTTKHFCFTHLTLHEYLAACWFVKRGDIPPGETVSTMVIQFMAGILSDKKDRGLMEKLLEQLSPDTGEVNRHLLQAKCLYEYQDKELAKDHYRQHPVRGEQISFSNITDVDCIAISYFLDTLGALNEEEPSRRHQTLPPGQPPFMVKEFEISDSEMTLSEQRSFSTIKTLRINLSMISSGLRRICASLEKDTCFITELDLYGNQITDAGVVSLSEALKESSCKLTTLHLDYNQITDAGVVSLSEALKESSCKLTTLHLGYNQITDAGVVSLSEALKESSCKLTTLDLYGNQITDAGVVSLSEALKETSCKVTTLHLNGNQITDAGVVSLSEALKESSCKLTTLHLGYNQITDAGVVSLSEALKEPSCKLTTLHLDL